MNLSIAIAAAQEALFLILIILKNLGDKCPLSPDEMKALWVGVALFTFILSIPAIIWNVFALRGVKKTRPIVGIFISALTLTIGAGALVMLYFQTLQSNGAVFI